MSAISSMNKVPPCASSSAPTLRLAVPLPPSTPKNSGSICSCVIAAALLSTEGAKLLELPHLALKARILERPFGHQQQAVDMERLFDEVICAALVCGHRGFD